MVTKFRTVRVKDDVLQVLDKMRKETGTPISRFIELAVNEKLNSANLINQMIDQITVQMQQQKLKTAKVNYDIDTLKACIKMLKNKL